MKADVGKILPSARRLCLLGCAAFATTGGAIDILVYTNADTGNGSLRQAIQFNNSLGGGNTILFSNSCYQPHLVDQWRTAITASVTIVGPRPDLLTIDGNNISRVFRITNSLNVNNGRDRTVRAPDNWRE